MICITGLMLAGCKPSKEDSEGIVKNIGLKAKPGMTPAQIKEIFGEPTEIAKEDFKTGTNAEIWRYKGLNEFYELWVRFANGKVTWTLAYDKESKLNTG